MSIVNDNKNTIDSVLYVRASRETDLSARADLSKEDPDIKERAAKAHILFNDNNTTKVPRKSD